MNSITLFMQTKFLINSWWKLRTKIQGFQKEFGDNLVTEIDIGRIFRVIEGNLNKVNWSKKSRLLVQFYEDGYICWININKLEIQEFNYKNLKFLICNEEFIQKQIPSIIRWIIEQSTIPNKYLWGGTTGPDFDCSGLIQTAFFKHHIFIPRDSYQIKNFCHHLFHFPGNINNLMMGDLLFFGTPYECNHVAIYFKDGLYFHSSGKDFGRDGIGIDSLTNRDDKISLHYMNNLLSAGRIIRSYKWDKTIR